MDDEKDFSLLSDQTFENHLDPEDPTPSTRSIHDDQSVQYYKEVLKADNLVLSTLTTFHKIPFKSLPEKYYERNNKSAMDNKQILWDKMLSWEQGNYVTRVTEPPKCISPMSVVTQPDFRKNTVKRRPCLDLSRHVNLHIADTPMSISHLSAVEDMLIEGDFQTLYDLENMYFQIKVIPEHRQYLGCQIEDPGTGKSHYFVFNVLIYGLKHAVATVTKLTKPVVDYLNKEGIRNTILIDDGRVLSRSVEEGRRNHKRALEVLQNAGWRIQWAKTDGNPSQTVLYQGLVNCTKPLSYFLPFYKIERIVTQIEALEKAFEDGSSVPAKTLSAVLGTINSGFKALGPLSRILMRSAYSLLSSVVQPFYFFTEQFSCPNWNQDIDLNLQVSLNFEYFYIFYSEYFFRLCKN